MSLSRPPVLILQAKGADPLQGVEMASTGEVACLGNDLEDAFLKSIISADSCCQKECAVSIGTEENKYKLLDTIETCTGWI